MKKLCLALAFHILFFSHAANAADGPNIFQIYDQMVISKAAASKCEKMEERTARAFQKNFDLVSRIVSSKILERHPGRHPAEISRFTQERTVLLTQKTQEMVQQRGCADPEIQQLIRRFHAQSNWNPPK